jgi:UDP-3-O-[3-hydroxymyristoyl] glucosamine N-acyltransferase
MHKSIPLSDIITFLSDDIKAIYGIPSGINVHYLKDPENVDEYTLDWVNHNKKNKQQIIENTKAKVIITSQDIEYSKILKKTGKVILIVNNPKLAIAKVGNAFFVDKMNPEIHPTAVIHPEAVIGNNVFIGSNVYIGNCKIGDDCKIYPNVTIYNRTTLGNNVSVHAGAAICVDGLGCQRMSDGKLFEFPQLGGVIIEDNVYIGANTQIASGALSNTFIGKGSKINGLSFIGSNCHLGKNTWITGSTMLAGSVIIGPNSTIFSKVIIRDHCKIGSNVTIGMGSVVTKSMPDNETWIGNPARKIQNEKP